MIVTAATGQTQKASSEIGASNYEQLAQGNTAMLTKMLSLSAAQATTVLQINKDYFRKIATLRTDSLSIEQRGQRLQLLEKEHTARLQQVLSPEQYQKFEEERQRRGDRIKRITDSLRATRQLH